MMNSQDTQSFIIKIVEGKNYRVYRGTALKKEATEEPSLSLKEEEKDFDEENIGCFPISNKGK
jgi:hypothetical protein